MRGGSRFEGTGFERDVEVWLDWGRELNERDGGGKKWKVWDTAGGGEVSMFTTWLQGNAGATYTLERGVSVGLGLVDTVPVGFLDEQRARCNQMSTQDPY